MKMIFIFILPFIGFAQSGQLITNSPADSAYRAYSVEKNNYLQGKLSYLRMPGLIQLARGYHDTAVVNSVAHVYMVDYLETKSDQELLTKPNLVFIRQYNRRSNNRLFQVFYKHREEIDNIVGISRYATEYIDLIISSEEIYPHLFTRGVSLDEPNWLAIEKGIEKKYDVEYAKRNILNAKIQWLGYKKDSVALVGYEVKKMEDYGLDTAGFGKANINNTIYCVIFRHSNNAVELRKALKWMEMLIEAEPRNPQFLDTYANLLYKLGDKNEAIMWEHKALDLGASDPTISEAWDKMNSGIPTW